MSSHQFPYFYAWANNPKRATMARRPCRIVATGKMGSVMIEFQNGQREITSRRALRKMPPLVPRQIKALAPERRRRW
jgi:hypothetical protein